MSPEKITSNPDILFSEAYEKRSNNGAQRCDYSADLENCEQGTSELFHSQRHFTGRKHQRSYLIIWSLF